MARYTFGEPLSEDDVLIVQGVEYPMMPVGMRAMRRMLVLRSKVDPNRPENDHLTEADLDMALDIVTHSVRPEVRDKFKEHIEESVPPDLLVQIATAVMSAFSDLDPTQPESSSGGSLSTGPASTDGAPVEALTPTG